MTLGLDGQDIELLLDDLSTELAARGARADLFLVGGAALAVAYDRTRSTAISTRSFCRLLWYGRRQPRLPGDATWLTTGSMTR